MNPDVALLVLQFRTGNINADQFAQEMRQMNYSLPQIIQIMNDINNPRVRQPTIPEPAGVPPVIDRSQPQPTPAPAPAATPAPVASPVMDQRDPTVRSEEGPTYGRPEAALLQVPRSEEGPWYGRPEPTATTPRAVQIARQTLPQPQAPQAAPPATPEDRVSGLMRFIRGDFRDGADQRVMEAMRRQQEESGVSGKAEGGAATKPAKTSKDDVLHKALEIIHHMMVRR